MSSLIFQCFLQKLLQKDLSAKGKLEIRFCSDAFIRMIL